MAAVPRAATAVAVIIVIVYGRSAETVCTEATCMHGLVRLYACNVPPQGHSVALFGAAVAIAVRLTLAIARRRVLLAPAACGRRGENTEERRNVRVMWRHSAHGGRSGRVAKEQDFGGRRAATALPKPMNTVLDHLRCPALLARCYCVVAAD